MSSFDDAIRRMAQFHQDLQRMGGLDHLNAVAKSFRQLEDQAKRLSDIRSPWIDAFGQLQKQNAAFSQALSANSALADIALQFSQKSALTDTLAGFAWPTEAARLLQLTVSSDPLAALSRQLEASTAFNDQFAAAIAASTLLQRVNTWDQLARRYAAFENPDLSLPSLDELKEEFQEDGPPNNERLQRLFQAAKAFASARAGRWSGEFWFGQVLSFLQGLMLLVIAMQMDAATEERILRGIREAAEQVIEEHRRLHAQPTSHRPVFVVGEKAPLRARASGRGKRLGFLLPGQPVVPVQKAHNGWWLVEYEDLEGDLQRGWVFSKHLVRISSNLTAPSMGK